MSRYGYVRVSSRDQNPERQVLAMCRANISNDNVFLDRMSGQDFQRPMYEKLMKKLKEGDTFVVKSIDRLGRNYGEILEEWRKITKEKCAYIEVLDMPLLNTNSGHPDLTGAFIADLVLQILAYVAQTEREFIKQRQAEGIAVARKKGIKFGCQKTKLPANFETYYKKWIDGKISSRRAAELLHMSHTTFYRRVKELGQDKVQEKL